MRSTSRRSIAQVLSLALITAPAARAEIAGEQVVSGEASFAKDGSLTTIHASDGAIIDYQHFSVLANEKLLFVQPASDARVLNRVLGDATRIDGALSANGIVYIVNPAGIFFGSSAVVNVGGLYAAAGNLSNEDFLAGSDQFTSLSGPVVNAGSIESPAVALLGSIVANHGHIAAPDGTIALVAGERVVLMRLGGHLAVSVEGPAGAADAPAIEQTGSVDAGAGSVSFTTGDVYSLAINHTGITRGREIELRAASGTVSVAGTLDASDRSAGATGGAISVTGERVALVGAQLDASGDAGGGTIHVGGERRGEGSLPNARRTYADANSALRADALASGDGGEVIVWADEATEFHGAISARGGASSGDGGFAEISGAVFLWSDGDVDLRAVSGANGTLLYDPQEIQLVGGSPGSGDGSDAPDTSPNTVSGDGGTAGSVLFADLGTLATPFQIYESEIEGTNANVVLQATHRISSTGTFDHDAAGEADGVVRISDGNSLTLSTRNAAGDATGATNPTPGIALGAVSFQTTGGGSVSMTTGDGAISVGDVTTAGAVGAANGGNGGAINIAAHDADRSGNSNVVTGALDSSGGNGGTGTGGNGGAVTVQSIGAVRDVDGTDTDPIEGGGSITVASIDATGGAGATRGGAGGAVVIGGTFHPFTGEPIDTGDGTVTVNDAIDTSGGAANGTGSAGGNAGSISILVRDADRNSDNDITTDELIARGGDGVASGGRGGAVDVRTLASIEITGATDSGDDQTAAGGGDVRFDAIDASHGTPGAAVLDGGQVVLSAEGGDIEHGAPSGPHIVTNGTVFLNAGDDVGSSSPIEIDGGSETGETAQTGDRLIVTAGGRADVRVTNAGFVGLIAIARTAAANIDITQSGGDVIDMSGSSGQMFVHEIDGTGNDVDIEIQLHDDAGATNNADLVLETGSVKAGGSFRAFSDGDIVVGTTSGTVITAGARDPVVPGDPVVAGNLRLQADLDQDGDGAVRDAPGSATGVIDMLGDADQPGALGLLATDGVGTAAEPIVMSGGGQLSGVNAPVTSEGDPDSTATSGVYVRNTGTGNLAIASGAVAGVGITAGTGDVEIENLVGDIRVASGLGAKPGDGNGDGGDLTLTVGSDDEIVLNTPNVIESGGVQTYDGDVVLARSTTLVADGGIVIDGGLDTQSSATSGQQLGASIGDGTTFAVADGIGTQRALAGFALASEVIDADDGPLVLDTPVVNADAQGYFSDFELAQTTAMNATGQVEFAGDVTGQAGAGLTVNTPDRILFSATGDQSVSTTGALALNPAGRTAVPSEATIAKTGGDLSLSSTGALMIGDGEKLSAAGALSLSGSSVRVTDLSALDITVSSPDTQVFARAPGLVTTSNGSSIGDGGTDLIANTVTFSAAPTVVGSGPAPRIATVSGSAQNPGALQVGVLPTPITTADLASGSRVFDLAIPTLDPGHETQELEAERIDPPLELDFSKDRAGAADSVSREEVAAFFACAPLGDEAAPAGCAPTAPPGYGTALDTERAGEVARAYRELLGDSPRAIAGRAALARAAAETKGDLGAASSPGGRVYLTDVARVLGQIRLLGLDARYREVRQDLLAAVAQAIGSPELDAERLGAAVDAHAMGMPI